MNRKEYNSAIDLHADGLFRFVLKSMNDEDSAKDVLQDVFTKLWEKKEQVEFTKAKSYLYTACYRTMLNAFRDKKKTTEITAMNESGFSHSQQYTGMEEILNRALNKLPDNLKSIILLRDYEGYSYHEIGEILSLGESQVKVYIFRARKILQEYLKSVESLI